MSGGVGEWGTLVGDRVLIGARAFVRGAGAVGSQGAGGREGKQAESADHGRDKQSTE